jgi:hypothetical protein
VYYTQTGYAILARTMTEDNPVSGYDDGTASNAVLRADAVDAIN